MSKLVWDVVGQRFYETGTKKGVLYVQETGGTYPAGVAWNGLTGFSESPDGGDSSDIYADDIEDATIERYNKGFEAVSALTQGKVDAVIIDNEPAKVFVSQNEGLKVVSEEFTIEEYAIAIKKGNTDLLNQVNDAISKLQESGKLQEIVDKYIKAE